MTRKQALHKALEALTDEGAKSKIRDILNDMPFTGWSERTIFDTLDQFVLDKGRNPTATDFKVKGMPPHPVIKLRFGISLKEFLQEYYPTVRHSKSQYYYNKTRDEWKEMFINEYHALKPTSSAEYDRSRKPNTPSWYTIAGMFGKKGWYEWLNLCDTAPYVNRREPPKDKAKRIPLETSSTLEFTDSNGVFLFAKNKDTNHTPVLVKSTFSKNK
jgi:hypothetical protein